MATLSWPIINFKERDAICAFIPLHLSLSPCMSLCVAYTCMFTCVWICVCGIHMFVHIRVDSKSAIYTDISFKLARKVSKACHSVNGVVIEAADPMPCFLCQCWRFYLHWHACTVSLLSHLLWILVWM